MTFLNQLGENGDRLARGAIELGLSLNFLQLEQLAQYALLLQKWSAVYNLTANKALTQIVSLHLLDSLAVVKPLLRELPAVQSILDVGSGAGLPGVVLSITIPDVQVHCIDAVAKKAAFINQIAISLGLVNLHAHHKRVESLDGHFDLITSRAFASLTDFVTMTQKNLPEAGLWLAMKGKESGTIESPLPSGVEVFHVEHLQVPDLDAARSIVWLKKQQT